MLATPLRAISNAVDGNAFSLRRGRDRFDNRALYIDRNIARLPERGPTSAYRTQDLIFKMGLKQNCGWWSAAAGMRSVEEQENAGKQLYTALTHGRPLGNSRLPSATQCGGNLIPG